MKRATLYRLDNAGSAYHVLKNGDIVRLDQPGFTASGQWKFLGLRHVRRALFIPFPQCFEKPLPFPLNWKNGKAQWHVVDLDHGTRREWVSPAGRLSFYRE